MVPDARRRRWQDVRGRSKDGARDGATARTVRQWGIWVDHALGGGVELRVREDGRANVSYVVFPAFRRRGHATAAVELAVAWGIDTSLGRRVRRHRR